MNEEIEATSNWICKYHYPSVILQFIMKDYCAGSRRAVSDWKIVMIPLDYQLKPFNKADYLCLGCRSHIG